MIKISLDKEDAKLLIEILANRLTLQINIGTINKDEVSRTKRIISNLATGIRQSNVGKRK